MLKRTILLILFIHCLIFKIAVPCTTFCLEDENHIYFSRNFDFPVGLAHVTINQRGIEKTSFISVPERQLTWVSKYGSVSFNQNGREFPYGGMNEAGLVIEQMMLDETIYPEYDEKFGLMELQWIQYHLDMSGSVQEVIDSDSLIRISYQSNAPLHFSVADQYGNFATIEYLDGKMVVHRVQKPDLKVLSNSTYQSSLKFLKKVKDKSEITNSKGRIGSQKRFAKASFMISENANTDENGIDFSFIILDSIKQTNTQWQVVYDIKNRSIYYKSKSNQERRELQFAAFDFSKKSDRLYIPIDDNLTGTEDFKTFSYKNNSALIDSVWNAIPGILKNIPYRKEWAEYPDKLGSKTKREFKHSAARRITAFLRKYNGHKAKTKMQEVINSKESFYFKEEEFVFSIMNIVRKDFGVAKEMLSISADLFPCSSTIQSFLGEIALARKNKKRALQYFKKACELDPNNQESKWMVQWLDLKQKRIKLTNTEQKMICGEYGIRSIFIKNNKLYYQKEGNDKMEMIPIGKNLFLFKKLDYFRIKIVLEDGKFVTIKGLYKNGRKYDYQRTK